MSSIYSARSAIRVRNFNPSNDEDLVEPSLGFHISVAGDVRVTDSSGYVATVPNLPVGPWAMAGVTRVWATGTTATITTLYL